MLNLSMLDVIHVHCRQQTLDIDHPFLGEYLYSLNVTWVQCSTFSKIRARSRDQKFKKPVGSEKT